MNPITGTVVGEDGKEVAVTMVQMVEKFEKSCKVTLHWWIGKPSSNITDELSEILWTAFYPLPFLSGYLWSKFTFLLQTNQQWNWDLKRPPLPLSENLQKFSRSDWGWLPLNIWILKEFVYPYQTNISGSSWRPLYTSLVKSWENNKSQMTSSLSPLLHIAT